MGRSVVLLCLCVGVTGCMEMQLKRNAVNLTSMTSDLFYLEVLDNIALTLNNPDALPYFDAPAAATAQIQRSVQGSYSPGWDFITGMSALAGRWFLDKHQATVTGQQLSQEAWQMATLSDPDRLYLMQAAYKRVTDQATPESERVLAEYYAARNGWVTIAANSVEYSAKMSMLSRKLSEGKMVFDSLVKNNKDGSKSAQAELLFDELEHMAAEIVCLTNPVYTREYDIYMKAIKDKWGFAGWDEEQYTENAKGGMLNAQTWREMVNLEPTTREAEKS
jgi:hypothetical protein